MLGTNVDYASTWLAMAGLDATPTYDGRSILTQGPYSIDYSFV